MRKKIVKQLLVFVATVSFIVFVCPYFNLNSMQSLALTSIIFWALLQSFLILRKDLKRELKEIEEITKSGKLDQ